MLRKLVFWFCWVMVLMITVPLSAQTPPDAVVGPIAGDVPLRLRAGPSTETDILAELPSGTGLQVIGRTASADWLNVVTPDGKRGWVFAEYVTAYRDLDTVPVTVDPQLGIDLRGSVTNINERALEIFQAGQALGNRAAVFAKIGDSITASRAVFFPIGEGNYTLDTYTHLQPAIRYFSRVTLGEDVNAFNRMSVAARMGWGAATLLDPAYADPAHCEPGESPLRCEYRLIRPAFALIMVGTNDVSYSTPTIYEANLRDIITETIDAGVVPVVSTLPPRRDHEAMIITFNDIIRALSAEYDIPLWHYGDMMQALGAFAFDADGVHPSLPAHGHSGAADFRPSNRHAGYVLRNLSGLHVLDALWREVVLTLAQRP